jgi:hypothetical protein
MIRGVGEEVCRRAVAPHEHPVFLVTEIRGTKPERAILIVHNALFLEDVERFPDLSVGSVQL